MQKEGDFMSNLTGAQILSLAQGDPLEMARLAGGWYLCPRDKDGNPLGPFVVFAGRYQPGDENFIGDRYLNFAKVEQWPVLLHEIANRLVKGLRIPIDVFCGMPMGGIKLAEWLGYCYCLGCRSIYPDKKVLEIATALSREKTKLVFGRHNPEPGDNVAIVEDVANNFSTTQEAIDLVLANGARPVAIVCFLNRSLDVEDMYQPKEGPALPVISLVRQKMPEWRQDEPLVAKMIAEGRVVWDPKKEWDKLEAAMAAV